MQCDNIEILRRKIGYGHPPFIIAEMSGNHNQSLDRALAIVEAAAKMGESCANSFNQVAPDR